MKRRHALGTLGATLLLPAFAARAAEAAPELPGARELTEYLAGRTPRFGRLVLELPRLADNGNAVPAHLAMAGPFPAGAGVRSIRLYSEKNPVPLMASFEFPEAPPKLEIDTRVRLAGTQRVAAIAELANGELHAAVADVSVTISACLDGS